MLLAVMSSSISQDVGLETTQPVPSSDQMALDVNINGSKPTDDSNRETEIPNVAVESEMNAEDSLLRGGGLESNSSAVADNSEIAAGIPNSGAIAAPTQSTEEEIQQARSRVDASEGAQREPSSSPTKTTNPSSASAQIESSSEIDTTSTQPPVVSAPESDIRENPTPVGHEEAVSLQEEKRELDALNDSDLARTTQDTEPSQAAERPISPATSADEVDQVQSSPEQGQEPELNPEIKPESKDDLAIRPATMSQLDINEQSSRAPTPQAASPGPSPMDTSPKSEREQSDTNMAEAPPAPSAAPPQPELSMKHGRDEDPVEESAAKRSKTESPSQNGHSQPSDDAEDREPLTPYQIKELRRSLKSMKGTNEGKSFIKPVVILWPGIKDLYLSKISTPIDLSIIDKRVADGYYKTMADYKADVNLLYDNCVTFNGEEHEVSYMGRKIRDGLLNKLPPREAPKAPPRKKGHAVRKEPPAKERRVPYQGTGHGQSPHPPAASAQTFALDPSGTPVIRRDSTKMDGGRPKRDIHPPKPRDISYNARPKKKKYATELKFCELALEELHRPKYLSFAHPFLAPVDPVALGIPDYFKYIKTPMDLSTVSTNLRNGHYETAKQFEADIRLIFKNCYKFNPAGTPVNKMGHDLEAIFDEFWAGKADYVAKHTVSAAASPDSSAESGAEESEDDDDEQDSATSNTAALLQSRLVDEQQKLIDIMSSNGDQALVRMQTEMVQIVKKQVDDFNSKNAAAKKKKTKSKAPSKKAQPQKKGRQAQQASKPYKVKHIGQVEKEQISAGITQLEGDAMDTAIGYLKKDFPELNLEEDPELDIDLFSNPTLSKLHDLIQRHCPQVIPPPEPRQARPQKPVKPKKNKPMSKHEQEKKIQQLRQLEQQFKTRQGSASDDAVPMQSVEQDPMSSSGDESPSDSEED